MPYRILRHSYHAAVNYAARSIDAICIIGCLIIASWQNNFPWNPYFSFFVVCGVAFFQFFARRTDLYRSWRAASIVAESKKVISVWMRTMFVLIFIIFFLDFFGQYFRRVFITWFVVTQTVLVIWRIMLRISLRAVRKRGKDVRTVVIAGAGELGVKLARIILNNPWMGFVIDGFYDDFAAKGNKPLSEGNITIKGNLLKLLEDAKAGLINTVYVTLPIRDEISLKMLIQELNSTSAKVVIVPDLLTVDLLKAKLINIEEISVSNIFEIPFYSSNDLTKRNSQKIKRLIDVILALSLFLILLPIMIIVAFLVLLLAGYPIFYKSPRYVSTKKKIRVLKFRTMIKDATNSKYRLNERFMRNGYLDIPLNCEIYTPIGRLLEKTQLVEVPQLINVIFNNMSFIGNRPLPLYNLNLLKQIEGWEKRFDSHAGMTGISQVVGKLNLTPIQRLELETMYSEVYQRGNLLYCDFMIFIFTIRLIFFKKALSFAEAKNLLEKCLK